MDKFNKITSIPAYLSIVNVDTDMMIPKQFLKTIKRTGLGKSLFFELRYDDNGKPLQEFVLNQEPYNKSKILVGEKNFGCGSSREHAPWALLDFGIRVVIAPSFADIFFNNCFKNGILPIKLSEDKINLLVDDSMKGIEFEVNLIDQLIIIKDKELPFDVDAINKDCLVKGLDDIGSTLERSSFIDEYEKITLDNFAWRNPVKD